MVGQERYSLLLRFQSGAAVRAEPISGRYLNNGYVPSAPTVLTARPPSRASPHTVGSFWVSGREAVAERPPTQASQLPQV